MKFPLKLSNKIFVTCSLTLNSLLLGVQATPLTPLEITPNKNQIATSQNIRSKQNPESEGITLEQPLVKYDPAKCNIFEDSKSIHCLGPKRNYQAKDNIDKLIQGAANYASKIVPLLNSNSKGSVYSEMLLQDGKNLVVDSGFNFANNAANKEIQKIPFFAQTSIAINASGDSDTSISLNSLMKLKEISKDDEGDLKTLFFGQARGATATDSDGATTNLGLGLRHRPNDKSMIGGNIFWDYRMTDYSSAHSRIGLGGEYLWKNLELRNNWYMAMTDTKTVSISGTEYSERIVPGVDVEVGYRLPNYPELGVFVKGFNWDYKDTDDQSGIGGSLNWQATPHLNLEAWVSNEIFGYTTKKNSDLPGTGDTYIGIQMKWTAQPINLERNNFKENVIAQMTQPVRRRYDVLLERSTNSFTNRAASK